MSTHHYEIEPQTHFSESLIWKLNQDFYHESGISAWSEQMVPHYMTSNSKVGKTYAELIIAFLKDLAAKGQKDDVVYILELGAGHGRLAFHILKHLEKIQARFGEELPKYCYVLSDIVEENLSFFSSHSQFQEYIEKGILDVTYFDALESKELYLRHAQKTILPLALNQPIVAIGNYFFDSLPNELFQVKNHVVSDCSISIHSSEDPAEMNTVELIKNMELIYHYTEVKEPVFEEPIFNELLEDYKRLIPSSYLFFPKMGMSCIQNLKAFSKGGLVLLTMDKGFHELHELQNKKEPEVVTHGSFSLWVNYHALGRFCEKQGGKALFPTFSNFHLEIGCLMFLEGGDSYINTAASYEQYVNDFGLDDFNSIKQLAYFNVSKVKLIELIALYRMSAYDSTFFVRLLPRLKQVLKSITHAERHRIAQTMDEVWKVYFNINEEVDLAYELGGMLYDLGYYTKALNYFQYSVDTYGAKADIYYNQALCYYQLRQDALFYSTLAEAKKAFPDYEMYQNLEGLDMG